MSMVMDDQAKGMKPIGDRVLLKFEEVVEKAEDKKTKSGIIMPGQVDPQAGQAIGGSMGVKYRAYIEDVGEKINLEDYNFNIGDWVIFNNMDVMGIDLPDPDDPSKVRKFGLTKPESIWGLYEV